MGAAASALGAGALALGLVRGVQAARDRGVLSQLAARKAMHTATGLVFMLTWPAFKGPHARLWAAAVPAALTVKFIAVGAGLVTDEKLVASATVRRHSGLRLTPAAASGTVLNRKAIV